MGRQPVLYVRKSRVFKDRVEVSHEMQIAEAKARATRDGVDPETLVLIEDMNISGRKGRDKRPGFNRLCQMIERGEVSTVYAYRMDRLSRSLVDVITFARMCGKADVAIHVAQGLEPDPTRADSMMLLGVLGAVAEYEAAVAAERSLSAAASRRRRGDKLGPHFYGEAPGEDVNLVREAYEQGGSLVGAARLLNTWRVPTRNGGGRLWHASTVQLILRRHWPGVIPGRLNGGGPGVKGRMRYAFARLLRCHCGAILTGSSNRINGKAYVAYRCEQARKVPDHGPAYVAEHEVIAWATSELELLSFPERDVAVAEQAIEAEGLKARRARILQAFEDGDLTREEKNAKTAAIDAELSRLNAMGRSLELPSLEWTDPPERINGALRALWSVVQMDENERPAEATWAVPQWRRERAPAA